MEEEIRIINRLSKENKIRFKFLDDTKELKLVQVCYNKDNEILELEFRNELKEYIEELKILLNKIWSILSKNVEKNMYICHN